MCFGLLTSARPLVSPVTMMGRATMSLRRQRWRCSILDSPGESKPWISRTQLAAKGFHRHASPRIQLKATKVSLQQAVDYSSQGTLSFLSGATLDFAATKLTRVSLVFTAKIVGTQMLSVPAYTQMQMETLIDLSEDFLFKAERCRNGRLRNFFSYWDLLVGGDQADFGENRPAAQLRDEVVEVRNQVSAGLCDVVNR
ncbi:hypothetical protein T09_1881 [Trichinella sp. T9]|nr:hypothetical protein T09_1881 [Trichinella sp. T9]